MEEKSLRERIYDMVEEGDGTRKRDFYDCFMIIVILISLIPLMDHRSSLLLTALDHITVAIFIVDYILRWITPFNVVFCFYMIHSGILRGVGEAKGPMIIMLSSFVAFRQIYLLLVMSLTGEFLPVILGYPIGWIVCAISMAIFYYRYVRKHWPA